jgi:hypothetical protein
MMEVTDPVKEHRRVDLQALFQCCALCVGSFDD